MVEHEEQQPFEALIHDRVTPLHPVDTGIAAHLTPLPGVRMVAFDVYGTLLCSAAGEIGAHEIITAGATRHASDKASVRVEALRRAVAALPADVARKITADCDDILASWMRLVAAQHAIHRSETNPQPEVDVREIWSAALAEFGIVLPDRAQVALLALAFELETNPVWPMPASLETLTALTRANIAVGIVSNAQFYTPLILETLWHTSLSQLRLDPLVWSYEIRAAKPGSAPFVALIDAVASRGIQPHEILYVGNDMLNDVKVAQLNGIHAALFAGDRRSLRMRRDDQRVSGVVPQRVVTDLSQLLTIVTTKPPNRAKGIQS